MMQKRKKPQFLRRDWHRKLKLGGRRKKLKWRRARGRHSKIRQKWKGFAKAPSIGYGSPREIRSLIQGRKTVYVGNMKDLEKIRNDESGIISSSLGKKKRIEISEKSLKMGIKFVNFNPEKFLQDINAEKSKEEKKELEKKTSKGAHK